MFLGLAAHGNTWLMRVLPVRDRTVYTATEDTEQPVCGGVQRASYGSLSVEGGSGAQQAWLCVYGGPARGTALSRSQNLSRGR